MKTAIVETTVAEDGYVRINVPNGDHKPVQKSQRQLWNEFGELTNFVFKDMTWEEIKKGRKDDENHDFRSRSE